MNDPARLPGRRQGLAAFLACWALFVCYSFLRVPVPGINEPHYLGMAKGYWNPGWCADDLFLNSSKPHRAFYLLIGWLTTFLSLEQTAIVGRFTALALAAWGWSKLCRILNLGAAGALLATSLVLLVQSIGSWSGEWLIGGVESKVFAYGCVFAAWAALLARRANASGLWLGLGTTMHPVVGMWATVTTVLALSWEWWRGAGVASEELNPLPRVPFRLSACLSWFITAAPGIGWALPALKSGDPALSPLADYIQVGYRLAHHLDPWTFPLFSHQLFAGLIVIWLVMSALGRLDRKFRFLDTVAAAAILIGLVATALSYGERPWTYPQSSWRNLQLKILKFYPFRMADVMAAVMTALTATGLLLRVVSRPAVLCTVACALTAVAIAIPGADQRPGNLAGQRRRDWIATLTWVRDNTPPDALLFAANEDFAVKWWAGRAEYVNFKDCPQDAAGVVEWNTRLNRFATWRDDSYGDQSISRTELEELGRRTGITHLIVSRFGPMTAEPVFTRGPFRVFDLRPGAGPPTK